MLVPLIAQYLFVVPKHDALPLGAPATFVDPKLVDCPEHADQIAAIAAYVKTLPVGNQALTVPPATRAQP